MWCTYNAYIETQTRTVKVGEEETKDAAISALQNAVYSLKPEDGRCRFVVKQVGRVVYSWEYQPTFRETPVKKTRKKAEPKYICNLVYYVLLNGMELTYENLYHDAQSFDSVSEAREYMKENGWGRYDYRIVYEYSVDAAAGDDNYGFGMGLTREEAREKLNQSIGYYSLVYKNGKVSEIK